MQFIKNNLTFLENIFLHKTALVINKKTYSFATKIFNYCHFATRRMGFCKSCNPIKINFWKLRIDRKFLVYTQCWTSIFTSKLFLLMETISRLMEKSTEHKKGVVYQKMENKLRVITWNVLHCK